MSTGQAFTGEGWGCEWWEDSDLSQHCSSPWGPAGISCVSPAVPAVAAAVSSGSLHEHREHRDVDFASSSFLPLLVSANLSPGLVVFILESMFLNLQIITQFDGWNVSAQAYFKKTMGTTSLKCGYSRLLLVHISRIITKIYNSRGLFYMQNKFGIIKFLDLKFNKLNYITCDHPRVWVFIHFNYLFVYIYTINRKNVSHMLDLTNIYHY